MLHIWPPSDTRWASGETQHFIACAEYDFSTANDRELKLKRGQQIRLAPSSQQPPNVKGWVLASDGAKIGLVPTNYIKILGRRGMNPVPNRVVYGSEYPVLLPRTSNLQGGQDTSQSNSASQAQTDTNAIPAVMTTSVSSNSETAEASDTETLKASRSSSTSSLFTPAAEGANANGVVMAQDL